MEIRENDSANNAEESVDESVTESTRVPSKGYEWDNSPEGYYAGGKELWSAQLDEVEESPQRYSERADPAGSQNTVCGMPSPGLATPQALEAVHSNETTKDSSQYLSSGSKYKLLRGLNYLSPTYPHFMSPTGQPEGLYCKTKRGIEIGLGGKHKEDRFEHLQHCHNALPSRATATLEGAASALSRFEPACRTYQQKYPPEMAHILESPGISRRIGLAPWHRKDSQGSSWSVTSSIREVLRGKTPAVTPNPAVPYATVDITNSNESTFLPSEARRVHTPPSSSRLCNGRPRGFFFDLAPSSNSDEANASPSQKLSGTRNQSAESHIDPKDKRDSSDSEELAADSLLIKRVESTDCDMEIPEHLPNSPLCPMHRKHKSGGTGLCVYHRRKRSHEL